MRPVMTFQGMWPITDTTRPLADLAAEGLADVPQLATDAGAVLIGPPVWRRITGPDGGPWLECRAPAWRARSHRAHIEAAKDPEFWTEERLATYRRSYTNTFRTTADAGRKNSPAPASSRESTKKPK